MQKKFILFLILLGFLASCMSTATSQTTPITLVTDIPSEILTSTPKKIILPTSTIPLSATETLALLASPTLDIITPIESPFLEIQQQCLEVRSEFQPSLLTDGSLIFISELFYTNEDTGPEDGNGVGQLTSQGMTAYPQFRFRPTLSEYAISPDQRYLAYVIEDNTELIVINAKGEKIASTPWLYEWEWWQDYTGPLPRWFGQHQVIFGADVQNPGSVNVLDPFTGAYQKVEVDFPNIYNPLSETNSYRDFWGDPTYAEFNTSLTRAAYLYRAQGENGLVLWNLETNSALWQWSNPTYLDLSHPAWAPDDTYLIAALPLEYSNENFYYDLFRITQEGEPTQLTNFKETYSLFTMILGNMVWSPDGRYLAFSLAYQEAGEDKSRLLLYDAVGERILDYCVQGGYDPLSLMTVYWSPDSQQMIVSVARTVEDAHAGQDIYLVDPTNEYITKLGEDWQIIGWMADDE